MADIRAVIESELGRPIDEVFSSIDRQPLAAASIAQVHACVLPDGRDAAALARQCLREGIVLAPGNAFSQSQRAADYLRFNVSQCQDPRIWQVLARALR